MSVKICKNPHAEGYNPNGGDNSPEVTAAHMASHEVSYEGLVLRLRETNTGIDDDEFALVWDEKEQRTREVFVATTRGWTYHNSADIDATHDVIAAAVAYETEIRFAEAQRRHAETPRHGYTARATEKGVTVEGVIAWVGKANNRYADIARFGIKIEGRKGYVFRNITDDDFAFDAEPVSEADMVEWRANCEHNAREWFAQAQALADARDPQPEPSSIVDSSEADADGWMLYAVGEAFADLAHSEAVAQHVVDEGAAAYGIEGARADGKRVEDERSSFRALGLVARYAETDGARIWHDGHGAVRVERADGAWMVLRPVRPVVEEPSAPVDAVSAPQAAVEAGEVQERPEVPGGAVEAAWVLVTEQRGDKRPEELKSVIAEAVKVWGPLSWSLVVVTADGREGPACRLECGALMPMMSTELAYQGGELHRSAAGVVRLSRGNGTRWLLSPVGVRGVVPLGG